MIQTKKHEVPLRWAALKIELKIYRLARRRKALRKRLPPEILIGAVNYCGQATTWSQALRASGIEARSLRIAAAEDPGWYSTDLKVEREQWRMPSSRVSLAKKVVVGFDGVVLESLHPIFALRAARDFSAHQGQEDLKLLSRCGVKVALIFHGSDIRDPQAHAHREEFSPYRNPSDPQILRRLKVSADNARAIALKLGKEGYPLLVTTPDLLLDLPSATWIPIAIDFDTFANAGKANPAFLGSGPLRVLYQPSRSWLKSHELIEPVLHNLEHEGVITLVPHEPIEHSKMAERIASADVVIDRFDGIPGVLAVEALACGRAVLANVAPWAHVRAEAIAPVHHTTPATLGAVLHALAKDRTSLQNAVEQNRQFVRTWHDGRVSAERIKAALYI